MTDKEIRANIKKTKAFIGLWVKFHDLYKNATKSKNITREDEKVFLETKSLIADKYKALKHSLQLNTSSSNEMMDVISRVLSLKGVSTMSDKALEKIERNWNHSYVFLNKILKDLENKIKEALKAKPVFSVYHMVILVLLIFIMFYSVNLLIVKIFGN